MRIIKGDVVLITGGAMGIGRLLALKFASLGADVVLWDINAVEGEKVVLEIQSAFQMTKAYFFQVDITDRKQVYATTIKVLSLVRKIDILINNAGIVQGQPILSSNDNLIEKTIAVNAISHFWTIKAFLPGMIQRRKGHIVSIASAAGIFGGPYMVDYAASKAAAIALMDSLKAELEKDKHSEYIHLTLVCPSFISTGMFKGAQPPTLTSWLTPEYAASSIVAAIQRNEYRLLMPAMLYVFEFLLNTLPYSISGPLGWLFNGQEIMTTFEQTRNGQRNRGLPSRL